MDAEIITVYETVHKHIVKYSSAEMSPATIKSHADLNTHHYGLIVTDDHESGVIIDLSHMMQEQLVGQDDDWDTFYSHLTPAMIDSYRISGNGLTDDGSVSFKQITIVHPLTTVGLDISYCDKKDTSELNKYYKRWDLPDLAIAKKEAYKTELSSIDLKNCIVSVNGIVCYSTMFEDTLYVDNGAKHLWCISKHTSASIVMLDTTPLGELVRLPLSRCKIIYGDGSGTDIYDKHISIQLPDGYSFQSFTPLLSIAGKLYYPDELMIPDNRTIRIKPYALGIQDALVSLDESSAQYVANTEVIYTKHTPVEYLSQMGKTDESDVYDTVYLIKNPNIYIHREHVVKDLYWLTKLHQSRKGILVRLADRSIMDYTTMDYEEYNLHHGVTYPTNVLRVSIDDKDTYKQQIGVREIRCKHVDKHFTWTKDSRYDMIYLTC